MKIELTQYIFTQLQLNLLLEATRQLEQKITDQKDQQIDHIIDQLPYLEAQIIRSTLSSQPQGSILDQLKKLVQQIKEIPITTVILAYQPTQKQTQEICQLLRAHFNSNLVIDIKLQPQLIAGVIIQHQGKSYDLSQSSAIEEYLSQQPKNQSKS